MLLDYKQVLINLGNKVASFCQEVLNPQVLISGCLLYSVVDDFSVRVTQAPRKKKSK